MLVGVLTGQEDACGDDGGALCEWVLDSTDGNEVAAVAADWLISRPVAIVGILVGSWLLAHLSRWVINRVAHRVIVPPDMVKRQLDAFGLNSYAAATDKIDQDHREGRAESVAAALGSTATVIIWTSALLSIVGILGVELRSLLAGVGVMGIALGFGAQSLVRDCINGAFMLLEDQYGIGDTVDLGSVSGTVEQMSLRRTVLRDLDGTVWHVPNGEIQRVGNQSQLWSVALVDFNIAYSADIDHASEVIAQTATKLCEEPSVASIILAPPMVLGVEAVGMQGVTIRLLVKTTPGEQWGLQRTLRERVKNAFDENGIEAPFAGQAMWMGPNQSADPPAS